MVYFLFLFTNKKNLLRENARAVSCPWRVLPWLRDVSCQRGVGAGVYPCASPVGRRGNPILVLSWGRSSPVLGPDWHTPSPHPVGKKFLTDGTSDRTLDQTSYRTKDSPPPSCSPPPQCNPLPPPPQHPPPPTAEKIRYQRPGISEQGYPLARGQKHACESMDRNMPVKALPFPS